MLEQQDLIHNTKWNILCVLDACRYDSFNNLYKEFLDGELSKVKSPGSNTAEWLHKTWTEKYEATYISTNPYINKGLKLLGKKYGHWEAKNHFKNIHDIFLSEWDPNLGTVPPWNVNKTVLNLKQRSNLIIHYIQPHLPYIGKTKVFFPVPLEEKRKFTVQAHLIDKEMKSGKITQKKLKEAYEDNLRLVLLYVAKLIPHLKGKIVITSDHGELLDTSAKKPWHFAGSENTILREVPWLELNGDEI